MTTSAEPHHPPHRPCPIAFVIGPSGAGKSTLAAWTGEDLGLTHLEIDRYPHGDGIDLEGLRHAWDTFWLETDAHPLAATLRARAADTHANGVVLSLPSGVVPHDEQLDALARENITLVVLYGSGADCMDAFLRREQAKEGRLGTAHWVRYNAEPYASLSTPRFAPFRLTVFEDGAFRCRATLVAAIDKCLRR